jgi:opacity protein-like surface antigen
MSRRSVLAGLCISWLSLAFGVTQPANAADCWINVATGERLGTLPIVLVYSPANRGGLTLAVKTGEFSIPGGISGVRTSDGSWINVATGERLGTLPIVLVYSPANRGGLTLAVKTGEFSIPGGISGVRVPCPPPSIVPDRTQTLWYGGYFGGEIIKNGARVKSKETSAATGAVTNQFSDDGDPIGGGVVAGWNFALANNWIVGPFASFDGLRQTINHTFPAGFYLGTTTHWIANLGGRAGYLVTPDWQVYGLAGAAWLNESLNINFPAGFSTKNATVPGFTLGLGTEYQPASWAVAGHPISLFAQYQHTWYADATFNMPTPASPGFNYAFRRDDDTLKVGVIVHLSPPAPPPPPPLIHK